MILRTKTGLYSFVGCLSKNSGSTACELLRTQFALSCHEVIRLSRSRVQRSRSRARFPVMECRSTDRRWTIATCKSLGLSTLRIIGKLFLLVSYREPRGRPAYSPHIVYAYVHWLPAVVMWTSTLWLHLTIQINPIYLWWTNTTDKVKYNKRYAISHVTTLLFVFAAHRVCIWGLQ